MGTERMGQTADLTTAGFARWAPANARERNFWIALAFALLFHAAFFVGAIRSKPAHLGDPTGDDKAISVSLVTEADLKSRSTIAEPPDSPPAPPPVAATPPPPPETPKPPQPEAKQPPVPDTPKPPEPTPAAEPSPEQPAEEQTAKQEDTKLEANAPDLFSLDDQNPAKMKSESKPKPDTAPKKAATSKSAPKKQPSQKRMSSLDLSTPPSMMQQPSMNSGRSAAFQRPPGITRSGVNDAFARAVIRALQQTMPQLNGALGRVTVRILLSESGNVVEVKLLAGAKDPTLSQDVVFAAQQTSYPIPPVGSNVADRTFMVTYVYD